MADQLTKALDALQSTVPSEVIGKMHGCACDRCLEIKQRQRAEVDRWVAQTVSEAVRAERERVIGLAETMERDIRRAADDATTSEQYLSHRSMADGLLSFIGTLAIADAVTAHHEQAKGPQ